VHFLYDIVVEYQFTRCARLHLCPPEYRPDEELFDKALKVCGPVLRDCLYCWQMKSTKCAREAIKKAAYSIDLVNYQFYPLDGRITTTPLSNLALLVPNEKRLMSFSYLSKYAEQILFDKIGRLDEEQRDCLMANLQDNPKAGSLEGMMWQLFWHWKIPMGSESILHYPLCGGYIREYGLHKLAYNFVGPLHRVGFFDITQMDLQNSESGDKRIPKGYYRLAPSGMQAAIDAIVITEHQHVVLFKYTLPHDETSMAEWLNAIKDKFEQLGLDELIPYNSRNGQQDTIQRDDWSLFWVVATPHMDFHYGKKFGTSVEDKWMDSNIQQYKHDKAARSSVPHSE
jgi:hypothetical protein